MLIVLLCVFLQVTEEPSCEEGQLQLFESDSGEEESSSRHIGVVKLDWVGQTGSHSDRQISELSGLSSVVLLTQPNSHNHSGIVVQMLSSPVCHLTSLQSPTHSHKTSCTLHPLG